MSTKQEKIKLVSLHGAWVGDRFFRLFFNRVTGKFIVLEETETIPGSVLLKQVNPSMIGIVSSRFFAMNCFNLTLAEANEQEFTMEIKDDEIEVLASCDISSNVGNLRYIRNIKTDRTSLEFKYTTESDADYRECSSSTWSTDTLVKLLDSMVTRENGY
jgi:hypothetical protein